MMLDEFGKDADLLNKVCDEIKGLAPLRQITFEAKALEAVRSNNKAVVAQDEENPKKGGNVEAYDKIKGAATTEGSEFTIINWNQSAQHLVAYILVDHFREPKKADSAEDTKNEVAGEAQTGKKDEDPTEQKEIVKPAPKSLDPKLHPLMNPDCQRLGISFMGHKKCENVT